MPRIPVAAELERSPVNVHKGIVTNREAGQEEAATAEMFAVAGNVSSRVGRMAQYYLDQKAKKEGKEAVLNLKEATLGLELEMQKVQGSQAFNEGHIGGQKTAFEHESANFGKDLSSSARQYYDDDSRKLGMDFNAKTVRHGMVEEEHMNRFIYDKSTMVAAQTAAQNWDQMDGGIYIAVEEQRSNLREETIDFFKSQGITDTKILEAEYKKRVSSVHLAVVDSMVEAQEIDRAKAYMDHYGSDKMGNEITEADKKTMNDRIEPAKEYQEGVNSGIQAFDDLRSGKEPTKVLLDMYARAGTNKGERVAAVQVYDKLRTEWNVKNDELQAEVVADHANGGMGKADPRMAELKKNSITHWAAANHQISMEENRRAGKPVPKATDDQVSRWFALQNDGKFDGPEGRKNIELYKHKLGSAGYRQAIKYNTEKQAADDLAAKNGREKYTISARRLGWAFPKDATTEDKTRIKSLVEAELRQEILQTGKVPTAEDEDRVMFAQRESFQQVNNEWTGWRDGKEEVVKYRLDIGLDAWPTALDEIMGDEYDNEERHRVWQFIKQERLAFPNKSIDYDTGLTMYEEAQGKKDNKNFSEADFDAASARTQ